MTGRPTARQSAEARQVEEPVADEDIKPKQNQPCPDARGHHFPIKSGYPFPPVCTNCGLPLALAFPRKTP